MFAWVVALAGSTPIPGCCGICLMILGVANVIGNHLRTVATLFHEILPRYTAMPVMMATEQTHCGIKEVGGITIAQKLDTAQQPDMPESAKASGCVDFVLSPDDIAEKIVHIAHENPGAGLS